MGSHQLRIFQRAAVIEVGRDTCRAEGVAPDPRPKAERRRAALHHAVRIDAMHWLVRQFTGAIRRSGTEEGTLASVADAGSVDVGVEIGFEIMVRWHFVALAAFLMQPDPPALALRIVV